MEGEIVCYYVLEVFRLLYSYIKAKMIYEKAFFIGTLFGLRCKRKRQEEEILLREM